MDRPGNVLYVHKIVRGGIVPDGGVRTGGGRRSFRNGGEVGELRDRELRPLCGIVFTEGSVIAQVDCDNAFDNVGYEVGIGRRDEESVVGSPGCHSTIT